MSEVNYPRGNIWEPGVPGGSEWSSMDSMRRQILELRDSLRSVQDQLEYGPIHGQYYPIAWNIGSIGTNLTGVPTPYGRIAFSGAMKPVSLIAVTNTGTLTLDINYWDGSSFVTLLTSPLSVTTSGGQYKDFGDFSISELGSVETIGLLQPVVDSIDAGAPELLNIILTFKGLSKADYL